MGESVAEATITNWLKEVGDKIEADEAVLEIATDKVDSEVPSEVSGTLVEKLFGKDDLVQVGQTIAIIETEAGVEISSSFLVDKVIEDRGRSGNCSCASGFLNFRQILLSAC
jgi:2-oxoglutarate dehydrogenase E2 component (dihydrolipoamide succinyltransferase)